MLKTLENLQLFAHKKGGGSTSNGRDSEAKRLGAKAADGQTVTGGSILYRQRGTRKGRDKKQVSVYPVAK